MSVTILDGPIGTQLIERGIPTPAPHWSAWALEHAPHVIGALHREYAAAGATVHTANTFRTKRQSYPDRWESLTQHAVTLTRASVPPNHRVAGSIAPIHDCYSPHLSPEKPFLSHQEMAQCLAAARCDILLCETFPHVEEGLAAVRAAVETGIETWIAFTAGPLANLMSPEQMQRAAKSAADLGAAAVLVNCVPASKCLPFVQAISQAGIPFGVYANAGDANEGIGWAPAPDGPGRYADYAQQWIDEQATLIGSCCGTSPAIIAELSRRFAY